MDSNIYSSIQLSADRWLDIFEVLCIHVTLSEGEKQKRLIFLRDAIGDQIIKLIQRNIPMEESNV